MYPKGISLRAHFIGECIAADMNDLIFEAVRPNQVNFQPDYRLCFESRALKNADFVL